MYYLFSKHCNTVRSDALLFAIFVNYSTRNNKLIYKQIFSCISYKIIKCQVIYKTGE